MRSDDKIYTSVKIPIGTLWFDGGSFVVKQNDLPHKYFDADVFLASIGLWRIFLQAFDVYFPRVIILGDAQR